MHVIASMPVIEAVHYGAKKPTKRFLHNNIECDTDMRDDVISPAS